MSVVADFSVPADALCLGQTLDALPDANVELDRMVAHSPHHVMPFLWIVDTDLDDFERAITEDPSSSRRKSRIRSNIPISSR